MKKSTLEGVLDFDLEYGWIIAGEVEEEVQNFCRVDYILEALADNVYGSDYPLKDWIGKKLKVTLEIEELDQAEGELKMMEAFERDEKGVWTVTNPVIKEE